MATIQTINTGTADNAKNGESLRSALSKVNTNFSAINTEVANNYKEAVNVFINTASQFNTWKNRILAAKIMNSDGRIYLSPAEGVKTATYIQFTIYSSTTQTGALWQNVAGFRFDGDTSIDQIVRLTSTNGNGSVVYINPSKFLTEAFSSIDYSKAGLVASAINAENEIFKLYESNYKTGDLGVQVDSVKAESTPYAYTEPDSNYFYDDNFDFGYGYIPRCKIQRTGLISKISDITLWGNVGGNTINWELYIDNNSTTVLTNLVASGTLNNSDIPSVAKYGNIKITLPAPVQVTKDQWLKLRLFCNNKLTNGTLKFGCHIEAPGVAKTYPELLGFWYMTTAVNTISTGALADAQWGTYGQGSIRVWFDNYQAKLKDDVNTLKTQYAFVQPDSFRLLVLGDSYTQGGAWVSALQSVLTITHTLNLGVGSATVKDRQADRVTYPYTSRPVQANNSGNLNVLACQVEKLKRLMVGVDLDAGEVKVYSTEAEYPNIIILQGGLNDNYDSDEKMAAMNAQFVKTINTHLENGQPVAGVYQRLNSNVVTLLPSMSIKTPIEEVDRTSWAGAYRYLVEQLNTLFPKAQIFIATVDRLSYMGSSDWGAIREKQAQQQRLVAQRLSVPVIDWAGEAAINEIFNHPQTGDGTSANPYLQSYSTQDASDSIHPNTFGAKKLGRVAANTIVSKYLDLYN